MRNAMQQRASILLAALMLAGTACAGNVSDPGSGKRVQMTLARDAYRSGDTVTIMVKNVSGVTLDYAGSLCYRALQRYQSREWSTVPPAPNRCTTLEIANLGSGQTISLTYRLASDLPAGEYRLVIPSPTPLNAQTPEPDVTTQPFSVNSTAL